MHNSQIDDVDECFLEFQRTQTVSDHHLGWLFAAGVSHLPVLDRVPLRPGEMPRAWVKPHRAWVVIDQANAFGDDRIAQDGVGVEFEG